jgi:hypothetical protein
LYSDTDNLTLIVFDKNLTIKQQLFYSISGFVNSIICEDESAVVIWDDRGTSFFFHKEGSSWSFLSMFMPAVLNTGMNTVAISKNGSVAIL